MACTRAPKGWYCTRGTHDGSCALWPTRWTRFKHWIRRDRVIPVPRAPKPHPNCRCNAQKAA